MPPKKPPELEEELLEEELLELDDDELSEIVSKVRK